MISKKPLCTPVYLLEKRFSTICTLLLYAVFFSVLLLGGTFTHAQVIAPDTTGNSPEVIAPDWPDDSLGRRNPRGTVEGFIEAVSDENYTKAARYLNLDTTLKVEEDGIKMVQALQRLLDHGGKIIPYSWISNDQEGQLNDNLGPNLDRVGTATVKDESFDIFVEKTVEATGAPIWLFSSQTIKRIPVITPEEVEEPIADRTLPDFLKENKWGGVPIGHWISMLLLAILSYLVAWSLTSAAIFMLRLLWHKSKNEPTVGIILAFELPIRLYLSAWILVVSSQEVGISIIVRQRFSELTIIVGMVAVLLLLWRLIDVLTRFGEKQMIRHNNMSGISIVLFLRRGAKIALLILGVITILSTFGFDVTTGIAALGIGGIALALGAQKTVENFVGSVTLIADQPIRVGDFCKVGQTLGKVEQIGMRSTRLRTNERTIVTIPNGEFSSLQIENFAHRDRYLINPKLRLHYQTTPSQIRTLLPALRNLLELTPKMDLESSRVRLIEITEDALIVEVFGYINTIDYNEFLEIQENLILQMMETVEADGKGLAIPSRLLYFNQEKEMTEEKTVVPTNQSVPNELTARA
ncbi:MAG: mechanosensitive ion channel protein MscS [Adhaeribacter sp.]|nr:mechanosensitive ion channel protein MscS [Adhaeribacter sp.]